MRSTFKSLLGISVALAALAVYATACTPKDGPAVDWPDYVMCGDEVAQDAITEVSRIVFGNGAQDVDSGEKADELRTASDLSDVALEQLAELGTKHGKDVITCLVDQLLQDWLSTGASITPDRAASVKRAQGFLEGKTVQRTSGSEEPEARLDKATGDDPLAAGVPAYHLLGYIEAGSCSHALAPL